MYVLYQCLNTDRFHKNVSFLGSINVQIDRETITMENERYGKSIKTTIYLVIEPFLLQSKQ